MKLDGKLTINNSEAVFAKVEPITPTIYFKGKDGIEILRLEPNGDIYIKGKLAENDKQITDGLRHFLLSHGY